MIPEAFTPSQYAARCFREMSPAEKRHIVEHPDDGTAAETVDFFRCNDDLELTDSQVDSVALHLSELCQLRDIDYGTARKLNESGGAITSLLDPATKRTGPTVREWYDSSAGLARAISAITGEDFGQPPDDYTEDDWRLEVANGDTVLGFAEWLEHKRESDEHDAEQETESELI